ncbi:hypothetical protein HNP46_000505 [Pseudomonas nitritireducens]|uniref:Uncharacterized protein n=1 Tax=Pseudomonas nitroreducens TaxID=46680 RepID=A0A7W7NZK5_PSENT|nr:hypothetical protein [Pseudomonas nitritireducens]MBB4861694.1 hypothetical protein [Pseudomonas nitritireducens]
MTKKYNLRNCLYCKGSKFGISSNDQDNFYVCCDTCGCDGPAADTVELAVDAWNNPECFAVGTGNGMLIKVVISQGDLTEEGCTADELRNRVLKALDDAAPQLPGFNVEIEVQV